MVAITPCAGFVQLSASCAIGVLGSICCYLSVLFLRWLDIDDAVDSAGIHGTGGFLGILFVGVFADPPECGSLAAAPEWCVDPGSVTRSLRQALLQGAGGAFSAMYAFVGTYVLLRLLIQLNVMPVLQSAEEQRTAQDLLQHGESAYKVAPAEDVELVLQDAAEDAADNGFGPEKAASNGATKAAQRNEIGLDSQQVAETFVPR